jgi:phospholipase/lecithinase/hemolysin
LPSSVGWAYATYNASILVPKLMARYESLVEEIYADGGRRFLFLNVPPTSRSPSILAEGTQASETHAAWVAVYNDGLSTMVESFKRKHRDVGPFLPVFSCKKN